MRRLLTSSIVCVLLVAGCADDRSDDTTADDTAAPTTAGESVGTSSTADATAPSEPGSVSVVEGEIETGDGRVRTYRAHVPEMPAGDEITLLLALHGGGGSASQFESASGFHELAATDGVLVVFPEGSGGGASGAGIRTWNAGECCGPSVRDGVDDVGFIRQLVGQLAEEHPIDVDGVVVAGHSNGAAMAYRLACDLSDHVVAIGVQAGPLGLDDCAPERPVSVLHLHGGADPNVPIDGGVGEGVSGVDFSPVRDGLALFARLGGCPEAPTVEAVPPGDGPAVTVERWTPCDEDVEVELRVVDGAGHGWIAMEGTGGLGGAAPVGYDATGEIWSFLRARSA